MKERPILFSAPMVRALLAGTKTQTRRVVKITHRTPGLAACLEPPAGLKLRPGVAAELCPYGQPGDRLWVRETWAPQVDCEISAARWTALGQHGPKPLLHFAADRTEKPWVSKWRPSIHMPRWASRITLEVTGVRVERLLDISDADAKAEGIERSGECNWRDYTDSFNDFVSARRSFCSLWESINGVGSWAENPWVWVVEFRRLP